MLKLPPILLNFPHMVAAALTLAPLAGTVLTAPAAAREISNVADATWTEGSQRLSTRSNTVTFAVSETLHLQTYVTMPGSQTVLPLRSSYCAANVLAGATAGLAPASAPGSAAPIAVNTPVIASSTLRVGQELIVKFQSASANRDPAVADQVAVEIETAAGDVERLVAIETGVDTGEFTAAITTIRAGAAVSSGDCQLALHDHERITVRTFGVDGATPTATANVEALADPFGLVFDSATGQPVNGARVTLIDAQTGSPAAVFAYDGVTPYPSSVATGSTVTDGAGRSYALASGAFMFPLTALGEYRLLVEPPAPYTAPSAATAAQIAALPQPASGPFAISAASYGNPFTLDTLEPVRVDLPVDAPGGQLTIEKTGSRDLAQPGDVVVWRVTVRNRNALRPSGAITVHDSASRELRLRAGSVRVNGAVPAAGLVQTAPDGRGFILALPSLAAGETASLTYATSVRPDATVGTAINTVTVAASGTQAEAQARLRITRDTVAGRMTVIGRVTDGGCANPATARGIAGVRMVLEDGSFAVTDADGRYHFEGVVPGNHVVQLQRHTLPKGAVLTDCARSTRSAGNLRSRFIRGQGGSLAVADYQIMLPPDALVANTSAQNAVTDETHKENSSAQDWLAMGDGPSGFITPAADANPRSPAIRVAVRHRADETARLMVDGQPVDPLAFEGVQTDPTGTFAISQWRGIHLKGAETALHADVLRADGAVAEAHERQVHFADTPMQVELVPDRSRLVADGTTPPVIAIRLRDRHGRPVHSGISGAFSLDAPYRSLAAALARQQQTLSGFGTAGANWVVDGDDGVALIELEPTLVSGSFRLSLDFSDGETQRTQELEGWIEPGEQPWTLIGLAEGAVGARSVDDAMERGGNFDSDLGDHARLAFYAKGRVLGKYLLTASYDSAKQRADQPLLGVVDPAAYYTIFADGSQRAYDAQSREKLYLRIESSAFYALYGDFLTGFTATDLAYYQRAATGVKGEARLGRVQAQGFAARIATSQRRDEIQGSGLTGPYRLSSRALVPGSETVAIEVRDRLRSEVIVERRDLVRFVDYTVDLPSGTITLAQPLAGRDPALNPQFIVVDYEVDDLGQSEWNGGLRASWTNDAGTVRIGATALSDKGEEARTNLGAADVRVRLGEHTELKGELGLSNTDAGTAQAWSAELRHHTNTLDVAAYARQIASDYGTPQQNMAERGRRKIGIDVRADVAEGLSIVASGWLEQALADAADRKAVELRAVRRTQSTDAYVGVAHLADDRADGSHTQSTVVEAGLTHRLLDNRLELSGSTSFALNRAAAIDLPSRHRIGARYALTPQVKALASYELAHGDTIDSRSIQAGLELSPIPGSRLVTTVGRQDLGRPDLGADAARSFAAFSLGQTVPITGTLTADLLVDGNRTLAGGIALADVANGDHPATSGGYLGQDGSLGEDYTAYSAGLMWRADRWSARGRGEWRDGELANRRALSGAVIRELGEGRVAGGGITWSRATGDTGTSVTVTDAALSLAWRPAASTVAVLGKLEFRSDVVTGAVAGNTGAAGNSALLVDGDAKSRRLIASTSANWSARGNGTARRTEVGVFAAVRHDFDSVEGYDAEGTSLLGGLDLRVGIGSHVEIGGRATVRSNLAEGTTSFAVGPELGISPAANTLVTLGYNVTGFRDRDFSAARTTDRGVFATVRLKFDADSFGFLGLNR